MVRRTARNNIKRIKIKTRSRRSASRRRSSFNGFDGILDTHISVRTLMTYSGVILAFLIVFGAVFMLGRLSADSDTQIVDEEQASTLSGKTKEVVKESAPSEGEEDVAEPVATELTSDETEDATDSEDDADEETIEYVYTAPPYDYLPYEQEDSDKEVADEGACTPKAAEFDYKYTNVEMEVSNFQRSIKGDNWASLDAVLLTVTNNEDCVIINPTQIKFKLNNKGKGSVWWDDEVRLPDSFKGMKPGETVSEVISIHVSYADIHQEKDFRAYLFDDYDIEMNVYKDYIFLP